ncbi:SulP family inorganic anion transporter [Chitinibacteraceae bacterium HSL-7]
MANVSDRMKGVLPHIRSDAVASITLLVLLVPQGLAYAVLAGLPPQAGLYASIVPVLVYALLGSSPLLSVGPAALPALMTAGALIGLAAPGSAEWATLAAFLALASGVLRVLLSVLRFGFIAHFLSQAVVGGFIAGSALLILLSQIPALLGIRAQGATLPALWLAFSNQIDAVNSAAAWVGASALLLLLAGRRWALPLLTRAGVPGAALWARTVPIVVMIAAALGASLLDLDVRMVGVLPQGVAGWHVPVVSSDVAWSLLPAISAIALIGFVDSYSIAQTLAAKAGKPVNPDRELLALGSANMAAGLFGAFPVSGSFGRSAANMLAGARTGVAGILAALWLALTLWLAPELFAPLPIPALAATIVVAVFQMVDVSVLRLSWRVDKREAAVFLITMVVVLWFGVLDAVLAGVVLSLTIQIWRSYTPHMAVLGRIPGTEHFRNVAHYSVETRPHVLMLRIDENLYFANAANVCTRVQSELSGLPEVRHLVLVMGAVNSIDVSALAALTSLQRALRDQGVMLHLSDVKAPVAEQLRRGGLLDALDGEVFISAHAAMERLDAGQDYSI